MDQELKVDPQYLKGFNHGYLLAQHDPELAKQIVSSKNDLSDYFKGFASGKQEYDNEKVREKLKDTPRKEAPEKTVPKDKGKTH